LLEVIGCKSTRERGRTLKDGTKEKSQVSRERGESTLRTTREKKKVKKRIFSISLSDFFFFYPFG
jgi:hypothetical protein